jgi:MFS family permease
MDVEIQHLSFSKNHPYRYQALILRSPLTAIILQKRERKRTTMMNQTNQTETASQSRRKWWVFLAVGIGTFMSALDSSVVNMILPIIREHFQSDVAMVEWTVVIYLLVVSSLLLSFGRIGDLRGHKSVYISGFLIFVTASMACGLATSVGLLVAGRAVQALGAAMLLANSPAILTKSFPPSQRGQVLGMQATMTYLGLTVGPSLGGWLTQSFGWRSVFYIAVPVGLLAFFLSLRFIEADQPKTSHKERFDWSGALLFAIGLAALLLGLNQGHTWGWTSLLTLVCLGGALALLATRTISNVGFEPFQTTHLFGQHHQRGAELHLSVLRDFSYALLPFAGARLQPRSRRTAPDRSTIDHGRRRAYQRGAFGSNRITPALHVRNGHYGAGVVFTLRVGTGFIHQPDFTEPGSHRAGNRHLHFTQYQRPAGQCPAPASRNCIGYSSLRPKCWNGAGRWIGGRHPDQYHSP